MKRHLSAIGKSPCAMSAVTIDGQGKHRDLLVDLGLRYPWGLEEEDVPAVAELLESAEVLSEHCRVRQVDDDQLLQLLLVDSREMPSDGTAPIVAGNLVTSSVSPQWEAVCAQE